MIRASEVLPGNRKVVHHVQTYLDVTGRSVELDQAEPGPGYTCFGGPRFDSSGGLGGWAPGYAPIEIPPGVAWGIPPGAKLVMQVHYHNPGDTPETDVTRVGVHFTSGPFDRRLALIRALAWNFRIPAGAARAAPRTWLISSSCAAIIPEAAEPASRSPLLQPHLFQRRRPRIRIDEYRRRLLRHPRCLWTNSMILSIVRRPASVMGCLLM